MHIITLFKAFLTAVSTLLNFFKYINGLFLFRHYTDYSLIIIVYYMYLYNKRHIFKGYSLFLAIFYNGFHYIKERERYFFKNFFRLLH